MLRPCLLAVRYRMTTHFGPTPLTSAEREACGGRMSAGAPSAGPPAKDLGKSAFHGFPHFSRALFPTCAKDPRSFGGWPAVVSGGPREPRTRLPGRRRGRRGREPANTAVVTMALNNPQGMYCATFCAITFHWKGWPSRNFPLISGNRRRMSGVANIVVDVKEEITPWPSRSPQRKSWHTARNR
jgi:hypothetical protein